MADRCSPALQIYTSAFYHGLDQTDVQAQKNKLNMLCEKVHMKAGTSLCPEHRPRLAAA